MVDPQQPQEAQVPDFYNNIIKAPEQAAQQQAQQAAPSPDDVDFHTKVMGEENPPSVEALVAPAAAQTPAPQQQGPAQPPMPGSIDSLYSKPGIQRLNQSVGLPPGPPSQVYGADRNWIQRGSDANQEQVRKELAPQVNQTDIPVGNLTLGQSANIGVFKDFDEKMGEFNNTVGKDFPLAKIMPLKYADGTSALVFKLTPDSQWMRVTPTFFEKLNDLANYVQGTMDSKIPDDLAKKYAEDVLKDIGDNPVEAIAGAAALLLTPVARLGWLASTGLAGGIGTASGITPELLAQTQGYVERNIPKIGWEGAKEGILWSTLNLAGYGIGAGWNVAKGFGLVTVPNYIRRIEDAVVKLGGPAFMPQQGTESVVLRRLAAQSAATFDGINLYKEGQENWVRDYVKGLANPRGFDNLRQQLTEGIKDYSTKLLEAIQNPGVTMQDAGKVVQQAIEKYVSDGKAAVNSLYSTARGIGKDFGDPEFELGPVIKFAEELQDGTPMLGKPVMRAGEPAERAFPDAIPGTPGTLPPLPKMPAPPEPTGPSSLIPPMSAGTGEGVARELVVPTVDVSKKFAAAEGENLGSVVKELLAINPRANPTLRSDGSIVTPIEQLNDLRQRLYAMTLPDNMGMTREGAAEAKNLYVLLNKALENPKAPVSLGMDGDAPFAQKQAWVDAWKTASAEARRIFETTEKAKLIQVMRSESGEVATTPESMVKTLLSPTGRQTTNVELLKEVMPAEKWQAVKDAALTDLLDNPAKITANLAKWNSTQNGKARDLLFDPETLLAAEKVGKAFDTLNSSKVGEAIDKQSTSLSLIKQLIANDSSAANAVLLKVAHNAEAVTAVRDGVINDLFQRAVKESGGVEKLNAEIMYKVMKEYEYKNLLGFLKPSDVRNIRNVTNYLSVVQKGDSDMGANIEGAGQIASAFKRLEFKAMLHLIENWRIGTWMTNPRQIAWIKGDGGPNSFARMFNLSRTDEAAIATRGSVLADIVSAGDRQPSNKATDQTNRALGRE